MDRAREIRLEKFRSRLVAEMKKIADREGLSSEEVLALCAHTTGAAIALQDQRTITPERTMEIVKANIEIGNREAVRVMLGPTQGTA